MKIRLKTMLCYVVLLAIALPMVVGMTVSASKVSDLANSPNKLVELYQYDSAMKACLAGDTALANFTLNDTSFGTDPGKEWDKFANVEIFNDERDIYSHEFEDKYGDAGWLLNDNGTIHCDEGGNAVFNAAFSAFGYDIKKDTATLRSLFCSESAPGIYNIVNLTKQQHNQFATACGENFDALMAGTKDIIQLTPNTSGALDHYNKWFRDNVGEGSLNPTQQKAYDYAKAAHDFNAVCKIVEGPLENRGGFGTVGPLRDAFSGKADPNKDVYYVVETIEKSLTSQARFPEFYTGINNENQQSCDEIAKNLSQENYTAYAQEVAASGDNFPGVSGTTGVDGTNGEQDPCYNADIESMAWLLCPTLNNGANAADGLMDIISSWLQVDPTKALGPEIETAWGVFRNIADIILIILFMAVIFSQVTGYGIDNYGIKKILPRLIVLAVIINLSFIVCEILVDLSNALGVGLYDLFRNVATAIDPSLSPVNLPALTLTFLAGAGGTAAIVAGIFAAAGGLTAVLNLIGGPTAIFALLMAVILALLAILIFFVMLGARMMAIIVLVIISPVAFALYALPNTQSLFKKWWKIMETCLVIYPICGALYGASYIIGAITQGTTDFIWIVIRIFAPFLPFFALPSLVKASIAALGAAGTAIAAIGTGLTQTARTGVNAVKGSQAYQDRQKWDRTQRTKFGAERVSRRLGEEAKRGPLSKRKSQKLARNTATLDAIRQDERNANALVAERRYAEATQAEMEDVMAQAFLDGNTDELDAMLTAHNKRFGPGTASFVEKLLSGDNGNINTGNEAQDKKRRASLQAIRDNMLNNKAFSTDLRTKASDVFDMVSSNGKDANGNYQNLNHFSANNKITKDLAGWSTQSAGTLARAIQSGKLSTEDAEKLLNSTDRDIQKGLQSEKSKVDAIKSSIYSQEHAATAEYARRQGYTDEDLAERYDAEVEERRQAEEARREAEKEAQQQSEDEARRQAEEEARRQAEEAARQQEEARRKPPLYTPDNTANFNAELEEEMRNARRNNNPPRR